MKQIEFTIVGKVQVPADEPEGIAEILEKIRELGEASVTDVRLIPDKEKKRA